MPKQSKKQTTLGAFFVRADPKNKPKVEKLIQKKCKDDAVRGMYETMAKKEKEEIDLFRAKRIKLPSTNPKKSTNSLLSCAERNEW